MRRSVSPLKVIRIYNRDFKPVPPINFGPLKQLYLELLQNPEKIKPELVNVEHNYDNMNYEQAPNDYNKYEDRNEYAETDRERGYDDNRHHENDYERDRREDDERDYERSRDDERDRDAQPEVIEEHTEHNRLDSRLQELLEDDDEEVPVRPNLYENLQSTNNPYQSAPHQGINDKYMSPNRRDTFSRGSRHVLPPPPTISELAANGRIPIDITIQPNNIPPGSSVNRTGPVNEQEYDNLHIDEREDDKKRELLFKIDILRKSYPNAHIPEYTIHTDLQTLMKEYHNLVRMLTLESNVENYKSYLIGGFMLVEFVLGNFFKFDMEGFAQQQILQMSSYEKLLIELGEKSYVPTGSEWSVEMRLAGLILTNAGIFIASKMIFNKTGSNIMNMMNKVKAKMPSAQPKRKMAGPDVNLDDL